MKLKIALCEDIPIVSSVTREMMIECNDMNTVSIFNTGKSLVDQLQSNPNYFDCFFLDIDLPDMTGIEVAEKIRHFNSDTLIIFLTSYSEYMPQVFKFYTFDYLCKPVNKNEIKRVLENISKVIKKRNKMFEFSYNKTIFSVPMQDIIYFEKRGRMVQIHTSQDEFSFYASSKELIEKLSDDFIRVHTSFFVNGRHIVGYNSNHVIVRKENNRIDLPVSRKFRESTKNKLIEVSKTDI